MDWLTELGPDWFLEVGQIRLRVILRVWIAERTTRFEQYALGLLRLNCWLVRFCFPRTEGRAIERR
jgi:hypothetical protein